MELQEAIWALGRIADAGEEDVEFYAREVAKSTGLSHDDVARELRELAF